MITGMLNNSGWHVAIKGSNGSGGGRGVRRPAKTTQEGSALAEPSGSLLRNALPVSEWVVHPAGARTPYHVPLSGSCSARPCRSVRSHGFVQDPTHAGRISRTLNITDEFTKEDPKIRVERKLISVNVVNALTDLFIIRGPPEYIRSNNGAKFIAKKVRAWTGAAGTKTAFIALGSPWENGYCESFNARIPPSRQIALQSPAG